MNAEAKARPSLQDERRELVRRRLEEGAVEVFAERGYAAASIDQVAKAAGLSRATFYLHFANKADLVIGLWGDLRVQLLDLYDELCDAAVIDEAFLEKWLDASFDFYANNKTALLAVHEAIALEAEVAEMYRLRMGEITAKVGPLIERSLGVSKAKAELRAALLTMQHERFSHFWLLRGMPFERAAANEVLAQLWAQQMGFMGRGE
ncbi:TetR/AcrR family transcriptional regulator [Nocardioides daejeonensis]|uniref:TetR/AcrR family transcriptional regulator n=1 Tax=Nocardioides daejeonensis TaxID=1046556 RepID=UPI000D743427|nr:TetR/AcrR family transcriptional regulator [Nocardioides daejeonensis]